jgi:hypothetical protein
VQMIKQNIIFKESAKWQLHILQNVIRFKFD